ncbi:hypothetical protein [Streptomyces sp. NPDC003032]
MNAPVVPAEPVIVCLDCRRLCRVTGRPGDETWRQCADVLYAGRPRRGPDAARLASRTLERYPGCALVVVRRADRITGIRRGVRRAEAAAHISELADRDVVTLMCQWYAEIRPGRSDGPRSAAHQER